jgi:hypothetical protein
MDEPTIVLPPSTLLPEREIPDCRWILRTFVERDAYVGYDHRVRTLGYAGDRITDDHVYLMNSAMFARSSRTAWARFTGRPLPELARIPTDLDLIESLDAEVDAGLVALGAIVARLTGAPGLTDMAVSKVLFLLRPRFVAISDSYVRESLGISDASLGWQPAKEAQCAARLRAVERAMRTLGQENGEALASLHAYANALPDVVPPSGPYRGVRIPVQLSKLRVLDIVLWANIAIHGPKPHPAWSAWHRDEVG